MRSTLLTCLLFVCPLLAQTNHAELRLRVTDPNGDAVKALVRVASEANHYRALLSTDDEGSLVLQRLSFGVYRVEVRQVGFADFSQPISIHSPVPVEYAVKLALPTGREVVDVTAGADLIDSEQTGAVNQIGGDLIRDLVSSVPGRSLQDLVNSQPGWLYEGNAVLHPRGSEYQTQFVVDGIPLTDNRSPGSGPELEADGVQSMSIYTSGFPAEYGRKMGGVVEVNTLQDAQEGLHGQVVLSGGSFDSAGALAQAQYAWGKNVLGATGGGSMTSHFLNPVVPQNFTNNGTLGDFSAHYERELTPKDRLNLIVRHALSRYELPNEQVQEALHPDPFDPTQPLGAQLQTASNVETMGAVSYEHVFSANAVANLRGMVRDNAGAFHSNPYSTPIEIFQQNGFREGYFKGTVVLDRGRQEWKFGVESDNTFLNENFSYVITDDSQFDPSTPLTFSFMGHRPDLEQSIFVQDRIRLGNWNISAGLRWDHYQLLQNRQGLQPRLSVSRHFPAASLLVHFSYDRVFQTPSNVNILLSSSTDIQKLNSNFLSLPVPPSYGNYYEAGLTKSVMNRLRIDANYFRRYASNFADDDQIRNTAISFPISLRKSIIYGTEAKLEMPDWRRFSGFLSYSYTVGNVWLPVTGGLFLGDSATAAETSLNGHFPDSQDQRHTVRGRVRFAAAKRLWFAGGFQYDSGLPFQFDGDPAVALQEYGQQVFDRINFARGRIDPVFKLNASAGAEVYKSDRMDVRFQIDGQNLTNILDVIDFGGLFSGNAIGPSRSFALRLSTTF